MTDATPKLSERLRNETREAHTKAERSGIMRDVLRGTIAREDYIALLHNLRALYAELESQLDQNRNHAALAGVNWPALKRTASLDADIAAFAGGASADPLLTASTKAYVQHLRDIGTHHPERLFPHAYLRYLGDLYGGQIMKSILAKTFAGQAGAFTFYTVSDLGDASEFKNTFRSAIDVLPSLGISSDVMVAEAARGYELHAAIFTELAA